MNEPEVFVLADSALVGVVAKIRDHQWDMDMPAEFNRRSPEPVTLRRIINYHAFDDAWVPDMLAGLTMDEAGADKFKGDLLGDDPIGSFARIADTACAAARALDDLDRVVHCSFGDFAAREYLWQVNFFRGVRAYEIAKVIGVDPRLPDNLVEGLWEEIRPHAEEWRAIGVFGSEVAVPDDADLQTRLLGITGRHP